MVVMGTAFALTSTILIIHATVLVTLYSSLICSSSSLCRVRNLTILQILLGLVVLLSSVAASILSTRQLIRSQGTQDEGNQLQQTLRNMQ